MATIIIHDFREGSPVFRELHANIAYNDCSQAARMVFHIKSEQVSIAKRVARTGLVSAVVLLGGVFIHQVFFSQNALDVGETLFETAVTAGVFFVFDAQRREYEIDVTDELISMRGRMSLGNRKVRRGHIHFLREMPGNILREPSLRISEHGGVYRFFFGYV